MKRNVRKTNEILVYADTGGTFTDVFLVDGTGDYALGKAPSTPDDPSRGYLEAVALAGKSKGLSLEGVFSQASVVGYGTTMGVNALLNRRGPKVGIILTKGFEHVLLIGRAKQSWLGYDKVDIIHARTHRRDEPMVPLSLIEGVTERINYQGEVAIPLYENEVRDAARRLLDKNVEAIVICFLFSFMNIQHEQRAKEIVNEIKIEMKKDIPIYLSGEICPVDKELARLNTTVMEAFITPIVSKALRGIKAKLNQYGYKGSFQIMQGAGGMASMETIKLVETMNSGPVGGLMGGLHIGELYGFKNLITTDVGGTSFDVGLITEGLVASERESAVARMVFGIPTAAIYSIGAGGGTFVHLDPVTNRLEVGPGSAEAVPGPICYDRGGRTPTITDCDMVLGYIDPQYFLGNTSNIKINREKAVDAIREQLAIPLKLDVAEVALGARKILDNRMRDTIVGMVMSRGYSISKYHLLVFGGAGATHCAGYTDGLLLKGIMIFPYSAAFCAFGASVSDYQHNFSKAVNIIVPPSASSKNIEIACKQLNKEWESLETNAYTKMEQDGFQKNEVKLRHLAMVRYGRQLDDLTVTSPKSRMENEQDWKKLIGVFENTYEQVFAASAKYPQAGYEILQVGLVATAPKIKPQLKRYPLAGIEPTKKSVKGKRDCYFEGKWIGTPIFDWSELKPGNAIDGPAMVESATTNIVLPPGKSIHIDKYLTVWLK